MGPAVPVVSSGFPLVKELEKFSMNITLNGVTVHPYILYFSENQAAAILPSETPTGPGMLTMTWNGETGFPAPITVVDSAFGVFTVNQDGAGPAIAQNYDSPGSQPLNSVLNPAHAGQTVILWGTGLAPATGDEASGPLPGNLRSDVKVLVGGRPAVVHYSGRSGCCAGVDQVNFDVPAGIEGCFVPLQVSVGARVANFTTLSVAGAGGQCSNPNGPTGAEFQRWSAAGAARLGWIGLNRTTGYNGTDSASANFALSPLDWLETHPGLTQPGACMASVTSGTQSPAASLPGTPLDAGAQLNLAGPGGSTRIAGQIPGSYSSNLYSLLDLPGEYQVSSAGGKDVSPLDARLTIAGGVQWTNDTDIATVSVHQDLTITWTGADPASYVVITGSSNWTGKGPYEAAFTCVLPPDAGAFTVPAAVLGFLPPTDLTAIPPPLGSLTVGAVSASSRFQADGLDAGLIQYQTLETRLVQYR